MNYFRRYSSISLVFIILCTTCLYGQESTMDRITNSFTQERQRNILTFLADDKMEGRASNSGGALMTLSAVNKLFKKWDMIPFYSGTFIQTYKNENFTGRNLAGVVLANGYSDKYIIVSAHYDHLGVLEGAIYNGADDNASGVTALITLANLFSQLRASPIHLRHNIIFLMLDGKENSLSGSEAFLKRLPFPPSKVIMNINIDQIGTTFAPPGNSDNYLLIVGNNSGLNISKTCYNKARKMSGDTIEVDYTFYGSPNFADLFFKSSDQYNFSKRGIPAILATSGIHMHTYKTTDEYYFINFPVLENRIKYLFHLIYQIAISY